MRTESRKLLSTSSMMRAIRSKSSPPRESQACQRAIERRNLAKFGDAVREDIGIRLTMVSAEEILLERPRAPGSKPEETKIAGDSLAQLGKDGAVLMVCRTCGKKGDHRTARCTYKDLVAPAEAFIDKPPASETAAAAAGTTKGTYVPPGMRRRNDENSVRVTNLSEDTREPDLLELFWLFGAISRVYVAVDQKTSMSRSYPKLNGYGHDRLILRIECATPRTN